MQTYFPVLGGLIMNLLPGRTAARSAFARASAAPYIRTPPALGREKIKKKYFFIQEQIIQEQIDKLFEV